MSRTTSTAVGLATAVFIAVLAPHVASAQQFSAELLRRDAAGQISKGRLLVAGDKIRIEAPDLQTGFFLIRTDAKTAYFVQLDRRVFMDARQSSILTELLVPIDPDAPCQQWQQMAEISGSATGGAAWQCNRIGTETHDGHTIVKYDMTSPRGKRYSGWIDPQLRYVVRFEADDGSTTELTNVQEVRQPDDAFMIPSGLRKFDPMQLMELVKHSDVWVDPAKDSRAEPLK
ncbi:MAG TPA: hypothetical protein VHB49_00320 [Bradyrhizobium sp.]|nr:hypothetical protein [Bradyrhizobium sp.]